MSAPVQPVVRQRFSKSKLLADLRDMMDKRQGGFDPGNGYAQVQGKGERANRDYTEWRTVEMIYRLIESGDIGV
jgi:hypothetical protein